MGTGTRKASRKGPAGKTGSKRSGARGSAKPPNITQTHDKHAVETSTKPETSTQQESPRAAGAQPNVAGAPTTAQPRPQPGPTEILGQVAWLMMQSPAHKHLFLTDLEWLVLPPLLLRQFRVFRRRNIPIAFVSWGFLSEDAEKRLTDGARRLKPDDWKSGDRLWLVDLIAPFGGQDAILKELRENVLKGKKVKALQPAPDGKSVAVVEW